MRIHYPGAKAIRGCCGGAFVGLSVLDKRGGDLDGLAKQPGLPLGATRSGLEVEATASLELRLATEVSCGVIPAQSRYDWR